MISIAEQCIMFCATALSGILIAVGFDFLRAIKKEFSLKKTAPIMDFLFWVFALVIFFYFLNKAGKGQLRAFVFLGVFSGFLFYILTFSGVVRKVFRQLLGFTHKGIEIVVKPMVFITAKIHSLFKKIGEIVQNKQKEVEKIVKKRLEKNQKNSII